MWHKLNRLIFFASMFSGARMFIGATSVLYLSSKGISLIEIGLLKSIQALFMLFFDLPIATYADKYGYKKSLCIAAFFASMWLLLTSYTHNFYFLAIAESFNAISMCLFNGPYAASLTTIAQTETLSMRHVFAKSDNYCFAFMAIAAVIGGSVSISSGFFWVTGGIVLFILFVIGMFLLPDSHINSQKEMSLPFIRTLKTLILQTIGNAELRYQLLCSCVLYLVYQVLIQYWQVIIYSSANLPDQTRLYGIIFFCILCVQSIASRILMYHNAKNEQLLLFFSITGIFIASSSILFSYNKSPIVIFCIIGLFFTLRSTSILIESKFAELIDPNKKASMFSLKSTLSRKFLLLLLPITGYLLQQFGALFILSIILCFFIMTSCIFFKNHTFDSKQFNESKYD